MEWWKQRLAVCRKYKRLGFKTVLFRCPAELRFLRPILYHFLAIRSGYGDFEWYYRKFNYKDVIICLYGRLKTSEYIVYCHKIIRLYDKWLTFKPTFKPTFAIPYEYWLRFISGPKDFEYFVYVTQFYKRICQYKPNGCLLNHFPFLLFLFFSSLISLTSISSSYISF